MGHALYLAKARSNQTVHGRVATPAVVDKAKSVLQCKIYTKVHAQN